MCLVNENYNNIKHILIRNLLHFKFLMHFISLTEPFAESAQPLAVPTAAFKCVR